MSSQLMHFTSTEKKKVQHHLTIYFFFPLGDGTGPDEQTAVAIASVQQATAFADHNIQYQFRTENNGGQVSRRAESGIIFAP